MFNLLKKWNENIITQIKVDKTTNQIIEEIHESFYTEVDKLLASALVSNCLDTDKDELIKKCERLKELGFSNTKEVKEAETEVQRLNTLKADNEAKKALTEAINYFTLKYPNYKFITEESVKKICEKYGLIYGEVYNYIGTVPCKNLLKIEQFKIDEHDECCFNEQSYYSSWSDGWRVTSKKFESFTVYKNRKKLEKNTRFSLESSNFQYREINQKCPLEIAAPLKDFNLTGMEVKDFKISKIEVPDPIVLKPVFFNDQKHYLIVTAWGNEASDEIIVNQKMN